MAGAPRPLGRLKVLRDDLRPNPLALRRFLREVRTSGALCHPKIVRVFDAAETGGRFFLAMEYLEGTDLGRLVARRGPLPVAVACDYARQAALGLQHAHEAGLVHRDVKPSNLMAVTTPGCGPYPPNIKLLDLGLARRIARPLPGAELTELTTEGLVVGTPDFMSPEQSRDSTSATAKSDLYGLGCTLFWTLTGRPVFPNGSAVERLMKHQLDAPPDIRTIRPDVPEAVAKIILELLAKQPGERIESGQELARRLLPWSQANGQEAIDTPAELALPDGETIEHRATPFDFGVRSAPLMIIGQERRKWLGVAAVALASLPVVVGGAWLWNVVGRKR